MKRQFTVSVIIPVFNERRFLPQLLSEVQKQDVDEIVIVDDGSTDGTQDWLRDISYSRVEVIYHGSNRGKGAAVKTGLNRVAGNIVIIQDADLEYDPADYSKLLEPILTGRADVVYGSRFVGSNAHRVLYFWHYLGNRFLTTLSNMFTGLNLTDMETGAKAFRTDIIKNIRLEQNRFGFEPEVTAKIAHLGCRVYEVGIAYHGRTYAEGKKIGWKDGVEAIWCIVKYGIVLKVKREV